MNPRQTYISINLILAGIILLMAVYSGFFSPEKNNYPLSCAYRIKTGKPCPTCGLSRSFSMMMRLRFSEARKYNPFGPRYFSFFALQFLARIALVLLFIIAPIRIEKWILPDAVLSAALFIWCFLPLFNLIVESI